MTKNVNMTRERKIALPVILEAAAAYANGNFSSGPRPGAVNAALEAFRSDK